MTFTTATRHIAAPHHRGRPLRFVSGHGPWLYDTEGVKWLDLICGYGPVVIGHSDPEFLSLVSEHLASGLQFASYSSLHEKYAEGLPGIWPSGYCAFFKTSSEAVTAAVRITSNATGKKGVIRCGFTGWHDVQQSPGIAWHLSPQSPDRRRSCVPRMVLRGVSSDEAVFDWVDLGPDSLEKLLRRHRERIGTLVLDTYQEELTDGEPLRNAAEICRRYGVLMVHDETKTSGRVCELGFTQQRSLKPDIVVAGKAIANGAPLSLLLVPHDRGDSVAECRVGGTHSKERFGVAAATVTRDLMARRHGYGMFAELGLRWQTVLRQVVDSFGLSDCLTVHSVLGGSGLDLRLAPTRDTTESRRSLQEALVSQGILALIGHPSFLTLTHSEIDLDWLGTRVGNALLLWSTNEERRKRRP